MINGSSQGHRESRVHSQSPEFITLKNWRLHQFFSLRKGDETVCGTDIYPLKPIQAFSIFLVGNREAECLPINHWIKVLCCAIPKSAPKRLILAFKENRWSAIWNYLFIHHKVLPMVPCFLETHTNIHINWIIPS